MVMTSQMYHILFEKPRKNEYIIIMNGVHNKRRSARKQTNIAKAN